MRLLQAWLVTVLVAAIGEVITATEAFNASLSPSRKAKLRPSWTGRLRLAGAVPISVERPGAGSTFAIRVGARSNIERGGAA